MKYQAALAYVQSFTHQHVVRTDVSDQRRIKRVLRYCRLLGEPQRGVQVVHITGTAGKGSVAMMIHQMLVASGRNCGLFTSPYASHPLEKIRLGSAMISQAAFTQAATRVKGVVEQEIRAGRETPKYFEAWFLTYLVAARQASCRWAVVEVGAGGRFDATNIFPRVRAAVITNIDFDHTRLLGPRLRDITWHKTGIIKRGCRVYTTEQRSAVLARIKKVAYAQKATCQVVNTPVGNVGVVDQGMQFDVPGTANLYVPLLGVHQITNATLALAVGNGLGIGMPAMRTGLRRSALPCRFEILKRRPLVICDGAHNRKKIRTTVAALDLIPHQRVHIVVALGETKNAKEIMAELARLATSITCTTYIVRGKHPFDPQVLAQWARRAQPRLHISVQADPWTAVQRALAHTRADDILLITGSFYLAGPMRNLLKRQKRPSAA